MSVSQIFKSIQTSLRVLWLYILDVFIVVGVTDHNKVTNALVQKFCFVLPTANVKKGGRYDIGQIYKCAEGYSTIMSLIAFINMNSHL